VAGEYRVATQLILQVRALFEIAEMGRLRPWGRIEKTLGYEVKTLDFEHQSRILCQTRRRPWPKAKKEATANRRNPRWRSQNPLQGTRRL
jgi:hypothetical protein